MESISKYVNNEEYKKLCANFPQDVEEAKQYKVNRINEWINQFEGTINMDIYEELTELVGKHDYCYYFYKLQKFEWEPSAWHNALLDAYSMAGYGHHDDFKEWFSEFELDYLTDDNREQYDALPDKVTVYRGCSVAEAENGIDGLSWSTDYKTALYFANQYGTDEGCVVRAEVDKAKIKAYISERNESECIIIDEVEYEICNQ